MIPIGDQQDDVSTNTGMKTLPVIRNSKEKTAMIKNYQTALVTGASHGLGPYIVRALAKIFDNDAPFSPRGADVERRGSAMGMADNTKVWSISVLACWGSLGSPGR